MISSHKTFVKPITAFLVVLAASVLLAVMPSSASALSWSFPASDVSTVGQNALFPQVAVAANGATTAVWVQGNYVSGIIQTSTRPAGSSTFGAVQNLSAAGESSSEPKIAMAANGAATVVWRQGAYPIGVVYTSTRPPGSNTFGATHSLSDAGQVAKTPQVSMAANGATTVIWSQSVDVYYLSPVVIVTTTRTAGSSSFGAANGLSDAGQRAKDPQVSMAANGATAVVWARENDDQEVVQARIRQAGSNTFTATANLSTISQNLTSPKVAIAANGATSVIWKHSNGSKWIVQARISPAGSSTFAATQSLSTLGPEAYNLQLAAAADGTATAIWRNGDYQTGDVQVSTRPAKSNTFGAPVGLSSALDDANNLQLAVAANRTATVIWNRGSYDSNRIIRVSTRPPGSNTFGAAVSLSSAGQNAENAQLAAAADGTATVVWSAGSDQNKIVQSRTNGSGGGGGGGGGGPFKVLSIKVTANALTSTITVPGRGKLIQHAVRTAGGSTVCKTNKKAAKSSTIKLVCKLNAATKKALRKRSLKVNVKTSFTPAGGQTAHAAQAVTLERKR